MKFLKIVATLILILVIVYLFGPKPATPAFVSSSPQKEESTIAATPNEVEKYVASNESTHKLKPDNEARIIWANDSLKQQTEYAIVYLHGFSASQKEGDPVHKAIAKKFGCNLYLSRLAEHGIDTPEALLHFTVDKYWESARQALLIGERLGKKVILMATSTGGSLALQLAATYGNRVYALVLLSPNIAIFDKNAWLLNNPWGLQIARLVVGSNYVDAKDERPIYRQYWNYHYRLEAAVQLEEYLETTMNRETFQKVHQPTLLLYYYRDNIHQDSVVSVAAMKKMFAQLGTDSHHKRAVNLPKAGNHVLGSFIKSNDIEGVEREITRFMEDILSLKAVN
jgi:pimeloyl-ACP methyl ester carboxylesterase